MRPQTFRHTAYGNLHGIEADDSPNNSRGSTQARQSQSWAHNSAAGQPATEHTAAYSVGKPFIAEGRPSGQRVEYPSRPQL